LAQIEASNSTKATKLKGSAHGEQHQRLPTGGVGIGFGIQGLRFGTYQLFIRCYMGKALKEILG
jgi:hypothetical protein